MTDTALENMKTILTDVRSLCVKGATDTLKEDDRRTILNQLKSLSDQIYAEGNADFSGRTVFTGYRTTEQRSEERRVGKECRSRWSPYH